jgi:hypothetical protein
VSGPRYARSVTVLGDQLAVVLDCGHVTHLRCDAAPRGWRVNGDSIDLARALRGSWSCTVPECGAAEP